MKIKIVTETGNVPSYETKGSSGMDLRAKENYVLEPNARCLVKTGLFIELPKGCEGQIRGRSGLALKNGITLANGVGTVDSDYRGEIQVILINHGTETFVINKGDRIAQLIVSKYERVEWEVTDRVSETERGAGGFGSSGK